jgi:hypothetical protein
MRLPCAASGLTRFLEVSYRTNSQFENQPYLIDLINQLGSRRAKEHSPLHHLLGEYTQPVSSRGRHSKAEREAAPFAGLAFEPDPPAVLFD